MDNYIRGEIIWVDFGKAYGHEQGGERPAIIVQNNVGNKYSPMLIVLPFTASMTKTKLPTHVSVLYQGKWSIAYGEQVRAIDKRRIKKRTCVVLEDMELVNEALRISMAL